jgi:predicted MPP superfamily phosphohydrolase
MSRAVDSERIFVMAVPSVPPPPSGYPGVPVHPAAGWDRPRGRLRGRLRAALARVEHAAGQRIPVAAGVFLVTLSGAILGAQLAPSTTATIGPLQAQVRLVPSLHPGVHLLLPPAGQVDFDTHVAPVALEARIAQVNLEGARALINSPAQVRALGDTANETLRGAAVRAAVTTIACSALGALVLGLLVYRSFWRRTAQVAITLVGTLVFIGTMAGVSADPQKLAQPRFTGLLSQAPYIAGQVPDVLQRLETYRSGLADIVRSVTALYATTGRLPELSTTDQADVTTVLHVSDIHLNPLAFDLIDRLVTQFGVDAVIDTGDITTWGTEVESSTLSRIRAVKVPYVFVRGNHDSARTEAAVRRNTNAIVLDDGVVEVAGLTIAGIGDPSFTPDPDSAPPATATTNPVLRAHTPGLPTVARSGLTIGSPSGPSGGTTSASSPVASPGALVTQASGPNGPTGPQGASNTRLAATIQRWDTSHPDQPVEIAAVHEPYQLQPLLGLVPTVMAGHTHSRATRVDPTGTRILIEGSTGGAGITARGLDRLAAGQPLPLAASLVYYARTGPRAGQIVAIDAITVGGFGLTSVNLARSVISPNEKPFVRRVPSPVASGSIAPTP